MPIKNYLTNVGVERSANEIRVLLARLGATRVTVEYDRTGQPGAMVFTIPTDYGERDYSLPVNVEGVRASLQQTWESTHRGNVTRAMFEKPSQAQRIAWRILKDWVEAQVAIVEAGVKTTDEVMMPDLITDFDEDRKAITFYRAFRQNELRKMLPAGGQG